MSIDAAKRIETARRDMQAVLGTADGGLLAAEIHLSLKQDFRCVATVSDGQPVCSGGLAAHACVRTWTSHGQAQVCVEDATLDAMAWALDVAGRTALAGTAVRLPIGIPLPPQGSEPAPPAIQPVQPNPELDDSELAALAVGLTGVVRSERLPARDVRISRSRVAIATMSTTGIAAFEHCAGFVAGAYVTLHHPLEPADALTALYHPTDAGVAIAQLLGDLRAYQETVQQVTGDPITSPPAGIAIICRPRATARVLELIAARLLGGQRATTVQPQSALSPAVGLVENPHDPASPRHRRFDDEGLPTARLVLVSDGRQVAHLHTAATAAAAGLQSNACAVRGRSHMPAPGYRGLEMTPTGATLPDLDEVLFIDDLIVSQEAALGSGAVVALGRLRWRGSVRPVRWSSSRLVDEIVAHTDQVAADGRWYLDGVHGRSVLVSPGGR